jgi:hypothetical protein
MSIAIFNRENKFAGSGPEPNESEPKKLLFISYSNDNYDKVKLIKKELENHILFEPLVIADRRKPNNALGKLIREGIDSAYCIVPILSSQSFKTQWINQEIGYAIAKDKPIIPIIEGTILKELKGFVNNQNQCPYCYAGKGGLLIRDENKSFMTWFRILVKDLEEEFYNTHKSNNLGTLRPGSVSIVSQSKLTF